MHPERNTEMIEMINNTNESDEKAYALQCCPSERSPHERNVDIQ